MNLTNGTPLFRSLVRAADLDAEVSAQGLVIRDLFCGTHGVAPHYGAACHLCVQRSRALSEIGAEGGRKGGRSLSPRKLLQLRKASRKAKKARKEKKASKRMEAQDGQP